MNSELTARLDVAKEARRPWLEAPHDKAFRLFNGYTEGLPQLSLDVYGTTLVVHDASDAGDPELVQAVLAWAKPALGFISCALVKERHAKGERARAGQVVVGTPKGLARRVREDGVTYALELDLNRDCSLYLDTRSVRRWAKAELAGQRVLNTFAYTGSLGVAAKAGGAAHVVHTDLNKRFLDVAKDSYSMNGWPIGRADFRARDVFDVLGLLKREGFLFDCVFVDPPLFSKTEQGTVDISERLGALLNKVRPLVAHEGRLVLVNNGVFVSGAAFEAALQPLLTSGYATLETRLAVDADCVGAPSLLGRPPPSDPAPYNHATKVAVLRLTRKDERRD